MTLAKQANGRLLQGLLVALALSYGLLVVLALFHQKPISIVQYFYFGADFHDFLQGARDVADGLNPYARGRFVTPPFSALLMFPLLPFSEPTAGAIFFVLNLGLIFSAVWLIVSACGLPREQRPAMALLTLFCPSTLMLVERGNIDGVVLLLTAIALVQQSRAILAGICLGAAISLKIYPAIMLIPMLLERRYRLVLVAALVVILPLIVVPGMATSFVAAQMARGTLNRITENLSVFGIFYAGVEAFPGTLAAALTGYAVLILAVLTLMVGWDVRHAASLSFERRRALAASYLVFATNIPLLVYLYSGVMLIVMLSCVLDGRVTLGRFTTGLLAAGLFLAFFPARSIDITLSHVPMFHYLNLLPPLGGGLLLLFALALRFEKATP